MSRADRAVQRVSRCLGPDEMLLASAVGYEHQGRRRQVVLLTGRRVVVADRRTGQPLEFALETTAASYDADEACLTLLEQGHPKAVIRDVEAAPAAQIVAMLTDHRRPL